MIIMIVFEDSLNQHLKPVLPLVVTNLLGFDEGFTCIDEDKLMKVIELGNCAPLVALTSQVYILCCWE